MRNVTFYAIAGLSLACASCSDRKTTTTYPASGKVMYDGSPASGAAISFFRNGSPPTGAPAALAMVSDDGSFATMRDGIGQGLLPGEYDVVIEWREVIRDRKGRRQRGPDKLMGRYANRASPLLHVAVEAKANDIPPFELKDR